MGEPNNRIGHNIPLYLNNSNNKTTKNAFEMLLFSYFHRNIEISFLVKAHFVDLVENSDLLISIALVFGVLVITS